jgi:hypothetical protein
VRGTRAAGAGAKHDSSLARWQTLALAMRMALPKAALCN